MLIKFENGRLGNQIFQYLALKSYAPKDKIVLIGMEPLNHMFEGIEADFILPQNSRIVKAFTARLSKVAVFLSSSIPLASTLEEILSPQSNKLFCKQNLLKNIVICVDGFFQNEQLYNKDELQKVSLKKKLIVKAQDYLKSISSTEKTPIFVHVRRGDYLVWPSKEAPAVLPLSWYYTQMDIIRSKVDNPLFIVMTDDQTYANEYFSNISDVHISKETEQVDFAIMSICDHGILSASSFSFWAAYFAKRKNNTGRFIAPLFWAGHQTNRWYPYFIKTDWLEYEKVETC